MERGISDQLQPCLSRIQFAYIQTAILIWRHIVLAILSWWRDPKTKKLKCAWFSSKTTWFYKVVATLWREAILTNYSHVGLGYNLPISRLHDLIWIQVVGERSINNYGDIVQTIVIVCTNSCYDGRSIQFQWVAKCRPTFCRSKCWCLWHPGYNESNANTIQVIDKLYLHIIWWGRWLGCAHNRMIN
jgi:hypothetical protein